MQPGSKAKEPSDAGKETSSWNRPILGVGAGVGHEAGLLRSKDVMQFAKGIWLQANDIRQEPARVSKRR